MLRPVLLIGLAAVSYQHGPLLYLYLFLFLSATAGAMGGPARSALLPQVVPIELFSNATTWSSSCFQIASVTGPALAGVIIGIETAHVGHWTFPTLPLAYAMDAACVISFAVMLLFITVRPTENRKEPTTLKTVLAGIHFVRRNQIILATITLDLFAVLLGGATYLLPIYAKDILKVGPIGFG